MAFGLSSNMRTEVMECPESPGATTLLDGFDIIVDPSAWLRATLIFDLEFL